MKLSVEYDYNSSRWRLNGRKVKDARTAGDHNRWVYQCGWDKVLKVDNEFAQSASEYYNYHHTPERWRKYLAIPLDWGTLPDAWQTSDDPCRTLCWIVQRRIPIFRTSDWYFALLNSNRLRERAGYSHFGWTYHCRAKMTAVTDFATELTNTVSGWYDGSERQYSIVKGRVCIHDYASAHIRTDEEYEEQERAWEEFDSKWAGHEHELFTF